MRDVLYDCVQLKRIGVANQKYPGVPYLVDIYGSIIYAPSAFLLHLLKTGTALQSVETYGRYLLDYFRSLGDVYDGQGLHWQNVDDVYLEAWRTFLVGQKLSGGQPTGCRGILDASANDRIALILRFCFHAERAGWTRGLIGSGLTPSGKKYKINAYYYGRKIVHKQLKRTVRQPKKKLPSNKGLDCVEARIEENCKDAGLIVRNQLIANLMRRCTLRRLEVTLLKVSAIPSEADLDRFAAEATDLPLTIPIEVQRAKRGGTRLVEMPPSLVRAIRHYIDGFRESIVKIRGVDPLEIFLSKKTAKALVPQSITNFYKIAAKKAEEDFPPIVGQLPLGAIGPHSNRHRAITDYAKGYLEAGRSAGEALTATMDQAAISSLDTLLVYLHLAQAEIEEPSEENKRMHKKRDDAVELSLLLTAERLRRRHQRSARTL